MQFELIDLYDTWLEKQGLPKGYSADELHLHAHVTELQRAWLLAFSDLWDADQELPEIDYQNPYRNI